MFDSQTIAALTTMADETEINPAALLAIAEVESGGKALFDIAEAKNRPSGSKGITLTAGCPVVCVTTREATVCPPQSQARYAIRNRKPRAGFCLNVRWA